jgi:hypothetical protein
MADLGGFDPTQVEPANDFDPIPAGKYLAVITDSEMKDTKSGTGEYLNLAFEIIEGEHKGRHLWARLNLHNPNATAVKIARAELSAICRAVNVMAPRDSVDLHNLPLLITIKCKKRPDTGEVVNEIKGYAPKDQPAPASAPPAAPAKSAPTTPPWKRG